jgi:hypothetical protein
MSNEPNPVLARISGDLRDGDRRDGADEPLLSTLQVFERAERNAFKRLDRRKVLRRHEDVRRRVARQ